MERKCFMGIRIIGDMALSNPCVMETPRHYRKQILKLIKRYGFTVTGHMIKVFAPGAFSLNFMLSESHVCLHTWPEENYFSLDLHTCNYTKDNDEMARCLFRAIFKLFDVDMDKCLVREVKE